MPKLQRFQRERERCISRTWEPEKPNFLVYIIYSAVYSRTYSESPTALNEPMALYDPVPFGFRFNPTPAPPLVPITGEVTLETPVIPVIPVTPVEVKPLVTAELTILVGTTSKPLTTGSFIVARVTILAATANAGVIWISSALGSGAGVGFPLVAGAAKDYGDPTSEKGVDLSTIFVIGTNPTDTIHLSYEKIQV